jgi:hypothetical protein
MAYPTATICEKCGSVVAIIRASSISVVDEKVGVIDEPQAKLGEVRFITCSKCGWTMEKEQFK